MINHKKYERMMHLYRDLDPTEIELHELDQHCMVCPQCAAMRLQIDEMNEELLKIMSTEHTHPDADQLTQNIMKAITPLKTSFIGSLLRLIDRMILQIFAQPKMRYGFASIALATMLLPVGQGFDTIFLIHKMEQRMIAGNYHSRARTSHLVIPEDKIPGPLTAMSRSLLARGKALDVKAKNGRIYVARSVIDRFKNRTRLADQKILLSILNESPSAHTEADIQQLIAKINNTLHAHSSMRGNRR